MYSTLRKFIYFCACTLMMPLQVHAVPNWCPPLPVSVPVPVPTAAQVPQICCDAEGNSIAVWRQDAGNNKYAIFGALFKDGSWQPPVKISNTEGNANYPRICCAGNGKTIVTWIQEDVNQDEWYIYGAGYEPGQSPSVTGPNKISNAPVDVAKSFYDLCCDQSGNAIVVWTQNIGGIFRVYGAGYTPGSSPESNNLISTQEGSAMAPQVCCDGNGNAIVVWELDGLIYGAGYIPGSSPDTNDQISITPGYARSPQVCCAGNGTAIVVWELNGLIYGAGYTPGSPAESHNPISIETVNANWPQVCCDGNGNAIVVWQQDYSIYGAVYTPGSSPASNEQISITPGSAFSPQACCDGNGNAIVVWQQNGLIYGAGYTPGASPATNEQMAAGDAPQLCCDNYGRAQVIWQQLPPVGHVPSIYSATYQPGTPVNPVQVAQPVLTHRASQAQLCVDDLNQPIAVWRQANGSGYSIFGSIFKNGAWQTPDQISQISDGAYPQLCCDGAGKAIVLWQRGNRIYGASYMPGSPSTAYPLSDGTRNAYAPQICCDAEGHALVAWLEQDAAEPVLGWIVAVGFKPSDPEHPITSVDPITDSAAQISNLKMCCDSSDHAILVWQQLGSELYSLIKGAGYTPGQPVEGPHIISDENENSFDPQLCCDDAGQAIVTWWQDEHVEIVGGKDIIRNIYGAQYKPGAEPHVVGSTKVSDMTFAQNYFQSSMCCSGEGKSLVVWRRKNADGTGSIYLREFIPGVASTPPVLITTVPSYWDISYPLICCAQQGNVVIIWSQRAPGAPLWSIQGTAYEQGVAPTIERISDWFAVQEELFYPKASVGCCDCMSLALWPEEGTIKGSCLDEIRIADVTIDSRDCATGNVIVTVTTSCGIGDLHYYVDGYEQDGPTFQLEPGPHTIIVTDSSEPQPHESEPYHITVPAQIAIDSIEQIDDCVNQTATIIVHASGGVGQLTYELDGITQSSPTFTEVQPGEYTITVTDSGDPYPCSVSQIKQVIVPPCPPPTPELFLPHNRLFLTGKYDFGAPIQSVAWSCPSELCSMPLVAVGGYKGCLSGCDCASIRVFGLDTACGKLHELFNDLPTDYVYSVNWCCLNDAQYPGAILVVTGCPDREGNSVWVYRYANDRFEKLEDHLFKGGLIYTTRCFEIECNGVLQTYFVIGGQDSHGTNLKVLTFDDVQQKLVVVDQVSVGDTIYALDVCHDSDGCVTIAVGGTPVHDCSQLYNIRLFKFGCQGCLVPVASDYYEGGTVRALKWCCQEDRPHTKLWYLAVGGDPIAEGPHAGKNIVIYYYLPSRDIFRAFASIAQPDKVFSLDWLQGCQCTYLAAGSGCLTGDCIPNIGIYNLERKPDCTFDLGIISQKHHDDNITSVATCKIGDVTYMLAGSESNNWQPNNHFDPLCPVPTLGTELAVYRGIFCKESPVAGCKPPSICERVHHIQFDE